MTVPDPSRRRLLAGIAALMAAAAGGAVGWSALRRSGGPGEASPTTVAKGTSSTTMPVTTGSPRTPQPATPGDESITTAPPTATARPVIEVIGRDAWGAAPITGDLTTHRIERLTVHHTGLVLDRNSLAPSRLRQHQAFHQDERGWVDLAYHFVIDAAGNVYEGRPADAVGDTATAYDPSGHLLVCCEGNFDQQSAPDPQIDALVAMLAWGAAEHHAEAATIAGHRDYAATSCPGAALDEMLTDGRIATKVTALIAGGGAPSIEVVTGGAARERVALVETS